jgi:hypothetical protein
VGSEKSYTTEQRLNAILNAPWTSIVLDSGWSAPGGATGQLPAWRVMAGMVQLRGNITHAAFSGSININASNPLPSSVWPSGSVYYRSADAGFAGVALSNAGVLSAHPQTLTVSVVDLAGFYTV